MFAWLAFSKRVLAHVQTGILPVPQAACQHGSRTATHGRPMVSDRRPLRLATPDACRRAAIAPANAHDTQTAFTRHRALKSSSPLQSAECTRSSALLPPREDALAFRRVRRVQSSQSHLPAVRSFVVTTESEWIHEVHHTKTPPTSQWWFVSRGAVSGGSSVGLYGLTNRCG